MEYDVKDPDYKKETAAKKYYLLKEEEEQPQAATYTFDSIVRNIPEGGSIASMPVFYEGVIYFVSLDTHLYAIEASTGKMLWKFKTGGPSISSPLIHNKKIYFGSYDGYFYCLNLSGDLVWKIDLGDINVTYSTAIGNKIFTAAGRRFFCLTEEGTKEWEFATGDGILTTPTIVNATIFVSSYDNHIYALDMEGRLKWKFATGGPVTSPIIFSENKPILTLTTRRNFDRMPFARNPVLYFASSDNNLYSISENGELIWKFNSGSAFSSGINAGKDTIYAGNIGGYLCAIDASSGRQKWNFRTGGTITAAPTVKDGKVFVSSWDQKVYCLSEDGEKIWEFLTGGPVIGESCIAGNNLYFGSADTFLYCLNIEKRNVEWTFQCGFGLPENLQSKITQVANAFVEYDKKIFRVWVPETTAAKTHQNNFMQNYNMPAGFSFGGEMIYSSNTYEASNRKTKRSPYDK